MMSTLQLKPLITAYADEKGVHSVSWPQIECLVRDGSEIAKIKAKPGAAIAIHPHVTLSGSEVGEIEAFLTAQKGQPPAAVKCLSVLYEKVLAAQDDEPEVDDE